MHFIYKQKKRIWYSTCSSTIIIYSTGVGIHSLSRGSSQPRNWTQVSCTAGRFFTTWATRKIIFYVYRPDWNGYSTLGKICIFLLHYTSLWPSFLQSYMHYFLKWGGDLNHLDEIPTLNTETSIFRPFLPTLGRLLWTPSVSSGGHSGQVLPSNLSGLVALPCHRGWPLTYP